MLQSISCYRMSPFGSLELSFSAGINALTGETGAGKSMVLECLSFVFWGRGRLSLESTASSGGVCVAFSCEEEMAAFLREKGIMVEEGETILVKRIVGESRRHKCYISDQPVQLTTLKALVPVFLEYHVQGGEVALLRKGTQLEILDSLIKDRAPLEALKSAFEGLKEKRKSLKDFQERAQRMVLSDIKQSLEAFDVLSPKAGEEKALLAERNVLRSRDSLFKTLQCVGEILSDSRVIEEPLHRLLEEVKGLPLEEGQGALESFQRALVEYEEGKGCVMGLREKVSGYDERSLEKIEERLYALQALGSLYRIPVESLENHHEVLRQELREVEEKDLHLKSLEEEVRKAESLYERKARRVSEIRQETAHVLEKHMAREFKVLKIEGSIFRVRFTDLEVKKWTSLGHQEVAFCLRYPDGKMEELGRAASGGEMSRLMLALKVHTVSMAKVIVFDEIDRGIGGQTSEAVAQRLYVLSKSTQVILITHSSQVAAYADCHFCISKEKEGIEVKSLRTKQGRLQELVRMLAGKTTAASVYETADFLLKRATQQKIKSH